MAEWMASKGTTALGIIGTALGGINLLGGNGLGWMGGNGRMYGDVACYDGVAGCSDSHWVNRYEAAKDARIAELVTDVKLRDANIYTDKKILETYENLASRINNLKEQLCEQAVMNQKTADGFALVHSDIKAVKSDLKHDIEMEAQHRKCGDNSIVKYVNSTFYQKLVADVTTGDTTTPQPIYNPLPFDD